MSRTGPVECTLAAREIVTWWLAITLVGIQTHAITQYTVHDWVTLRSKERRFTNITMFRYRMQAPP
jgi:hypothetical protein